MKSKMIYTLSILVLSITSFAFSFKFNLFTPFVVSATVVPVINNGYKIYTFTNSGSLTVVGGQKQIDYLIIGGGGGAPSTGGGGAGGFRTGSLMLTKGTYSITVGTGGTGKQNGNPSSAFGITADGGGYGGSDTFAGNSGGSGGGGYGAIRSDGLTWGPTNGGATVDSTEGFAGANAVIPARPASSSYSSGGGGGGAGGTGQSNFSTSQAGGNGGAGKSSTISGSSVCYAGGGAGGGYSPGLSTCGGGSNFGTGTAALNGTGGGAAGDSSTQPGGSGIVIVRVSL